MTTWNQTPIWLATGWAFIIALGLTYYIIRSWARGVITFPARVPAEYSRDANPGMFWAAMFIYLLFDAFAILCLSVGVYASFRQAA